MLLPLLVIPFLVVFSRSAMRFRGIVMMFSSFSMLFVGHVFSLKWQLCH